MYDYPMQKTLVAIIFLLLSITSFHLSAQNVVNELTDDVDGGAGASDIITEKIHKISASGRIFIITNTNEILIKGDFISILFHKDLVFRAMVAKVAQSFVAIKIVKIYSEDMVNKLRPGFSVQIIRGDDSYYKKQKESNGPIESQIKIEDNLFDDTLLEEDLSLEENTKRIIKQDNIVSISYASVGGVDNEGSSVNYGQFNGQWAYQFMDNVWAEIGFGQHSISDFPEEGLDTSVLNLTFRLKYIFAAPFYSYLMPYFGFQMIKASDTGDTDATQEQLDKEAILYDKTEKMTPVVGLTLLKRLVPGWFIRANLGSDMLSVGFSLEF